MEKVNKTIIKFIEDNIKDWDFNVIYSNAWVPGEGEHKLIEFIKNQRQFEDYDPNISHCIYGADADLIFLGLITHEPNFYILRESH